MTLSRLTEIYMHHKSVLVLVKDLQELWRICHHQDILLFKRANFRESLNISLYSCNANYQEKFVFSEGIPQNRAQWKSEGTTSRWKNFILISETRDLSTILYRAKRKPTFCLNKLKALGRKPPNYLLFRANKSDFKVS